MLLNYYTIRALAGAWSEELEGALIDDAYSSSRDELTLELSGPERTSLRISVRPGQAYAFRQDGSAKPRRNVVSLFNPVFGHRIARIAAADRDRVLDIVTDGGLVLRSLLFGSAANIFLGDAEGAVLESFRDKAARDTLPDPRPAPEPTSAKELRERWPAGAQPIGKAVFRAVPLFDREMAEEVEARAGLAVSDACLVEDFEALYEAVASVRRDALAAERPVLYRQGRAPLALTMFPLLEPPGEAEHFESVDPAVRAFVRTTLSERSFRNKYDPLMRDLEAAAAKAAEGLGAMSRELGKPSRAEVYEKYGHLLMATEAGTPAGRESVTLADLFGDSEPVDIPLEPALTGLENANRYYDRARRSRRAREEAERRVRDAERRARETRALLNAASAVEDHAGLKDFLKNRQEALARIRGKGSVAEDAVPFRQYILDSGDVVWVGRNAKQNDQLTFRHASKHDLWMHARGAPGSHCVLRRPSKKGMPPPRVIEQAASIAAYHSKLSGSALVPVIVTERKYVRSPRNAPPGTVAVEREEVILVPPRLPSGG